MNTRVVALPLAVTLMAAALSLRLAIRKHQRPGAPGSSWLWQGNIMLARMFHEGARMITEDFASSARRDEPKWWAHLNAAIGAKDLRANALRSRAAAE
ncbi:hypothetical protein [Pseudomarimonas arenosa]|uniref:hypothetical protein n=1 Tax=Pseudomarimonas arenosa TaxID=2774145 RepID=UPI001CDC2F3F|nr:hypothetical protein [Pseudomarimonas arenosa]